MTGGERSLPEHFQDFLGQCQKPQGIGNGGTGLPYPLGCIILGQTVLLHQGVIAQGFFHRVQILTLEVFNQRQLLDLPVVCFHDDGGNLAEICNSGCPPAPFTGDDLVVACGHFPDGQGLDHTMLCDGICQCL